MDPNEVISLLERMQSWQISPVIQEQLKLHVHYLKTHPLEERMKVLREFVEAHPKVWDVINGRQHDLPKPKDDEAFRLFTDEFYAD